MHTIAALALAATAATAHTAAHAAAHAAEVRGTFDVTMTPVAGPAAADDSRSRLTLKKTFHGPLSGTGEGEMLSAGAPSTGTAGYVALERFTGTLEGRRGTFVMQHSGTMAGGKRELAIVVTPGSGTGELAGIAGTASIDIENGKHYYTLRYTLP